MPRRSNAPVFSRSAESTCVVLLTLAYAVLHYIRGVSEKPPSHCHQKVDATHDSLYTGRLHRGVSCRTVAPRRPSENGPHGPLLSQFSLYPPLFVDSSFDFLCPSRYALTRKALMMMRLQPTTGRALAHLTHSTRHVGERDQGTAGATEQRGLAASIRSD